MLFGKRTDTFQKVLIQRQAVDSDILVFLKILSQKGLPFVSIDSSHKHMDRLIASPRIRVHNWRRDLFKLLYIISRFFKSLSPGFLFIVFAFDVASWKLEAETMRRRSVVCDEDDLRFFVRIVDNGNSFNPVNFPILKFFDISCFKGYQLVASDSTRHILKTKSV
jgi:hypothetical protein